jgi:hypothetical protein
MVSVSSSRHFGCLLVLSAVGCSEPAYSNQGDAAQGDAAVFREADSTPPTPSTGQLRDASAPAADTGPARPAAEPCCDAGPTVQTPPIDPRGRYGVLARFYGADANSGSGWFSEEITALAEISSDDAGKLSLQWQPCRGHTDVFAALRVTGDLLRAELAPARTYALQSDDGVHFRTQGDPALLGYQPLDAAACPPGTRVSRPDRSWLRLGSCTCPQAGEQPPTSTDDCRVIDSDRDTHPGATVRYSNSNDSYMAIRDRSQLTEGTFDARGYHKASYLRLADVSTMQCTAGPCVPGSAVLCPSSRNPVLFQPLEDLAPSGKEWTCSELLSYVASHPFELDDPNKPDC